jgi:hypothetical protein
VHWHWCPQTPSNPGSWIKDSNVLNENLNYSSINPYQKVNYNTIND